MSTNYRENEIAKTIINQINIQDNTLLKVFKAKDFETIERKLDSIYIGGVQFYVDSYLFHTKISIELTIYDDYTIKLYNDDSLVKTVNNVYWDDLINVLIDLKPYF